MQQQYSISGGASQDGKRSLQGLVSLQQSSIPAVGVYARHARHNAQVAAHYARKCNQPARLARLAGARVRVSPGRRYLATVASGDKVLAIDSAKARVYRAQSRIKAWSGVIPSQIESRKKKKTVLEVPRLVMVTLTYADAQGWQPNDIREYMQVLRKRHKNNILAYAWILETQGRGAPHYHVMLYVRRGTLIGMPDKDGSWNKGMSKIETARSPFYIMKYAGKEYQKEMLPAGARMFAVWINASIIGVDALLQFKMSSLPSWFRTILQSMIESGEGVQVGGWRRAKGGGWLIKSTGELHKSPWELMGVEQIYGRLLQWDGDC